MREEAACGRTIWFFPRFSATRAFEGYLSPTVSSGMAMRVSATIATVDNRSRPELTKGVGGAEEVGGTERVWGAGGVGWPSLSFTAGPDQAVASCAVKFTKGARAAVRIRSGAEVLIGTATAAVGMGAMRAASGLEWYPNQKTVAGAGVANGTRGWRRFAG